MRRERGHAALAAHAIILAGGRGTRFWPRSRTRTPKQLLNIVGSDTMLEQTAARLASLFPPSRQWVVTNSEQAAAVRKQMPRVSASHILAEPVGRNTAAAIAVKGVREVTYHRDYAARWFLTLALGTEESRRRLLAARAERKGQQSRAKGRLSEAHWFYEKAMRERQRGP